MNYKILVLTTLLCVMCLFGGCSSNVVVGFHQLPNGTLRQQYVVALDQEELLSKYTNEEAVTIFEVIKEYTNAFIQNVKTNAKECANSLGYIGEHCLVGQKVDNKNLTIISTIMYSNAKFYNDFMEYLNNKNGGTTPEEDENNEDKIVEGWLYDKIIFVENQNPVASEDGILSVYNEISSVLRSQGIEFQFDTKQANLTYDYAIPYTDARVKRLKSNADQEYVMSEKNTLTGVEYQMKHFSWTYDASGDNTIVLYRYKINSISWYLLAFAMLILFAMILLIVHFVKSRKKTINTSPTNNAISDNTVLYIGNNDSSEDSATKNPNESENTISEEVNNADTTNQNKDKQNEVIVELKNYLNSKNKN